MSVNTPTVLDFAFGQLSGLLFEVQEKKNKRHSNRPKKDCQGAENTYVGFGSSPEDLGV